MGKLVGFDKIKNYIKTDEGYILQSEWTSAETVELKSGATLQNALGSVNGIAELDSTGKVPSTQLPSYVDDVIEGYLYDGKFYKDIEHTSRINGESGKIYIDLYSEKTYRWSGSTFVVISETIALGETSSTAFRGDYGKIAYESSHTHGNKSVIDGITSALINNWNSAKTHADSDHAPSNAEKNIIVGIQKNGTDLSVDSTTRKVNVTVPTKVSELTNDSGYKTTDNNTTYSLSKSGSTITLTGSDGSKTFVSDSNTTYGVATSSALGLVKSGTDIMVDSSGNVSVKDDSHNHVISNVDGLQTALDAKAVIKTLTNENLNNITTPGFYNAGGGNSVTNKPSGVDNFGLEVIHIASGAYYVQIVYSDVPSLVSYRRFSSGATWSSWTQDKLTDTDTWRPLGTTADSACAGNDSRLSNARPANGGTSDYTKKLQTYKQGSTTETYGDSFPIYAQWRDNNHVKLKCDNYSVETDYANSAGSAPASDVYAWAKASSKPSYSKSEVGLGNVENKSSATIRSELTKANVIAALGYTPPSTDTNTHYASKNVVGSSTATSNTTTALTNGNVYLNSVENGAVTSTHKISGSGGTTVTTDTKGNIVINSTTSEPSKNTTYLLSKSGNTITLTGSDGSKTSVTDSDTNTTYGVVSTTANGLAPKRDGSTAKFLRGDGTWAVPPDTNTTYSNFVKSGSGAKAGLVPAPPTTAGTTKYLREDGTWQTVLSGGNKTAFQKSEPTNQSSNDEWLAEY